MTDKSLPSDLARQAAASAAAALQHRKANTGQEVVPGDVLVLHETSEQPVQWIVLARDPARPGRRLVVAADANQLVGTADLEVGDDALGPLVIRRPFGGWLNVDQLSPELRVGTLRLDRLARARNHWFDEANNQSVVVQEVDDDPEYQHWRRSVLEPAYRKLFEVGAKPKRTWWPAIAAAATLLLAVGGGQFWLSQQRIQEILRDKALAEKQLAAEIQDLQTTQQQLATRHQTELEEQKRWVADYEEKLARAGNDPGLRSILRDLRNQLNDAWSSVAVVNPVIEILRPSMTRGRVEIELPEDASHLVLLLKLQDEAEAEGVRYRLDFSHADVEEPFWSLGGLEPHSFNEIKVGIPAAVLEKGSSYDLRLAPERGPVGERHIYHIQIR